MVDVFKTLLGSKDLQPKKKVYMIQPSILYHTRTEGNCRTYLKGYFKVDSVHTPLDFRSKSRTFFEQLMKESEAVIGVTIEDMYVYPVWQDLEFARKVDKPLFTLRVVKELGGKSTNFQLLEGMVDFERLDWEETRLLYMEIQKKQLGIPLLFGRMPEY